MADAFCLRDALRGEEAAIQDLVRSVLAEFGLEFDLEGQDRDLVDIAASYDGGCFRVIEEAGWIVGCGGLYRLDHETGELRKMYVLPERRGRGWGRLLLGGLLDDARRRGMTRVTLESHSSLLAARALYESVGFRLVAQEHPTPRADIAMEWRLA